MWPRICPEAAFPTETICSSLTEEFLRGSASAQNPKSVPLLPISRVVTDCFSHLEVHNQSTDSHWKVPWKVVEKSWEKDSYRSPAADPVTGLGFSKPVELDETALRAGFSKPAPSSHVSIFSETIERWELRERKTLGLASQADFIAAALSEASKGNSENLSSLLLFLADSLKDLTAVTSASLAELIRPKRTVVL